MCAKEHECKDNEHIGRLAAKNDFFDWQTLWKANEKSKFRKEAGRANPNVLYKAAVNGDKVQIPDKNKDKEQNCDADEPAKLPTYVFKVPTYKMWLRLRILQEGFDPIEDAPYELKVEDVNDPFKGKTKKGLIKHEIPIGSTDAELTLRIKAEDTDKPKAGGDEAAPAKPATVRGDVPITWKLKIGKLNPVAEKGAPDDKCVSGIQQRLYNLRLYNDNINGQLDQKTKAAIKAFQELFKLEKKDGEPAKPEEPTQKILKEAYDSKNGKKPPA